MLIFLFVNKRASYSFGIISLAHVPVNVTNFSIGSIKDSLLTEKLFTQFTPKSSRSVICCYKQHIHISNQLVEASNVMVRKHRLDGRTSRKPYSDFIGFHDLFYYYNILVFLRYAGKIKLRRFDISRSTFVMFSFLFDLVADV
jgi:hypothetical protein